MNQNQSAADDNFSIQLDRFEEAWQSGSPPDIAGFLPGDNLSETSRRDALLVFVIVDLEYRWKLALQDETTIIAEDQRPVMSDSLPVRPRFEDYLARYAELGAIDELPLELIVEEYRIRRRWGDRPNHHEYLQRFPGKAEQLSSALSGVDEEVLVDVTIDDLPADFAAKDEDTHPAATIDTLRRSAGRVIDQGVEVGQNFGDYELLEEVARGGMGVVFKARQVKLNRVVALKMILSGQLADQEEIKRFQTEAESAAKLDHPCIVPIHEISQHQGQHYFSMGFVDGQNLQDELRDGPLPPKEAAELCLKIAEAVAYAHNKGVIHRDLKPANVILDAQGEPRVTDFGLAKRTEADRELTVTGQVLGTPGYMSPEQANGDRVTQLTDVYSLGAMLYAFLLCHPPFHGKSSLEVLRQVREESPVPIRALNQSVPRDLDAIVLKCLNKSPSRRYQSASDLSDDLGRFLRGEAISARLPSAAEHVWRWCGQWRRIDDVAKLTLAFSAIFAIWNLVGLFALATGFLPTESVARSLWIVGLDFSGFVVFFCLGLATFSGRLPVLWTGLAVSVGVLVFAIACLFDWIYFDGGGWLKDSVIRVPVFLFFSTMAIIQLLAYVIALVAGYAAKWK